MYYFSTYVIAMHAHIVWCLFGTKKDRSTVGAYLLRVLKDRYLFDFTSLLSLYHNN